MHTHRHPHLRGPGTRRRRHHQTTTPPGEMDRCLDTRDLNHVVGRAGGLDHVRAQCYRYRETQPNESSGYARPENRGRSTPATDHEQVNGEPAQSSRTVQPPVFARACWVPKEEPGPEEWLQTVPENWWEE